jgi:hypothetical protein
VFQAIQQLLVIFGVTFVVNQGAGSDAMSTSYKKQNSTYHKNNINKSKRATNQPLGVVIYSEAPDSALGAVSGIEA